MNAEIEEYLQSTLKDIGEENGVSVDGSYFVETIGSTSKENIRKYIERQNNVQM